MDILCIDGANLQTVALPWKLENMSLTTDGLYRIHCFFRRRSAPGSTWNFVISSSPSSISANMSIRAQTPLSSVYSWKTAVTRSYNTKMAVILAATRPSGVFSAFQYTKHTHPSSNSQFTWRTVKECTLSMRLLPERLKSLDKLLSLHSSLCAETTHLQKPCFISRFRPTTHELSNNECAESQASQLMDNLAHEQMRFKHACIKSSPLWRNVRSLTLTINMKSRLFGDQASTNSASDILKLADGKVPLHADRELDVHSFATPVSSLAELTDKVFPYFKDNYLNHEWLSERAVLAPKNVTVTKLNDQLLQSLPGAPFAYKSVDTMVDANESVNFPTEFLNSLYPPGLPPHLPRLKVEAPVMLLRNLEPPRLCNGRGLVVKKLMKHVVFVLVVPQRLQLPLRPSFAISVNKSQGQTPSVAGPLLEEPCFSHGQMYVACSRVSSRDRLFALTRRRKTRNIVYNEVLHIRQG
uniref:DNA helicase Pif1-like 2B domain-containing protein n=1 Tax=Octopus bimaculoides TaxID=37653 RepID=A0A0L8I928_OCTBM